MTNLSQYRKAAEYRNGELKWFYKSEKEVFFLVVTEEDTLLRYTYRNFCKAVETHVSITKSYGWRKTHPSTKMFKASFDKCGWFDVYIIEEVDSESQYYDLKTVNPRRVYLEKYLNTTIRSKISGYCERERTYNEPNYNIDLTQYKKVGEFKDGTYTWFCDNMRCVVYLVAFDKEMYIGSTINLRKRFSQYRELANGKYPSYRMQRAYDRTKSYEIYVIEQTEPLKLRDREEDFISALRPSLNIRQHTESFWADYDEDKRVKEEAKPKPAPKPKSVVEPKPNIVVRPVG